MAPPPTRAGRAPASRPTAGRCGVEFELDAPAPQSSRTACLAFNLGVEIGQACVVVAVAPLLGLLHARRQRWATRAVVAGSAAVVAAGAYWFVERALLA